MAFEGVSQVINPVRLCVNALIEIIVANMVGYWLPYKLAR